MLKLLLKLLISGAVIFGLAYFSQGELLVVGGWQDALLAAVVLGLVNTFIKPLLKLLTLPLNVMTLGLFSIVINTFMLYIVSWVVPGFETVGILRTVAAALIVSIGTAVLYWFVDRD